MSAPQGKAQVRRLWNTAAAWWPIWKGKPEKLPQARQFFLYYLDTAAHLLERYQDFQRAGVRSPEVRDILRKQSRPCLC